MTQKKPLNKVIFLKDIFINYNLSINKTLGRNQLMKFIPRQSISTRHKILNIEMIISILNQITLINWFNFSSVSNILESLQSEFHNSYLVQISISLMKILYSVKNIVSQRSIFQILNGYAKYYLNIYSYICISSCTVVRPVRYTLNY